MAHLTEPLSLEIERSSVHRLGKDSDHTRVDYSKLPRSSGDGMEFTSSSSSEGSSSESSNEIDLPQGKDNSSKNTGGTVKEQNSRSHVVNSSPGIRTTPHPKNSDIQKHNDVHAISGYTQVKQEKTKPVIIKRNEDVQTRFDVNGKSLQHQNSTNLLFQEPDLPSFNSQLGLTLNGDSQFVSLAPPASELSLREHGVKSTVVEHTAEFVDSRKVINDLEEQNSKLVEEKTKLSVQLGVQTKVNAEIKRLLVASVGEDIGNRLEDLVNRNVQQAVELDHWKKMCEEYSEESDRLEIECDVWRTKFLASRMMSDELSTWKVALYTRFRQAQNALQRLLDERAQLLQYLVHTKRLLQSLYSVLRSTGSMFQGFSPAHTTASEQSIIEMASINSSLAEDTLNLAQNVLPTLSLSQTSLILAQKSQDNDEKLKMEPTSAEKLALQVLSTDVHLQDEQQQLRSVMKRMSQQYMGHGYQSRFSTKNFRVTYDCCERCTGGLQVV